jgi:hypothetical protein
MQLTGIIGSAVLLAGTLLGAGTPSQPHKPINSASLSELEQRLTATDLELSQLASYSLRTGVGAVGYRSQDHSVATESEWIQIDLDHEKTIDQIVLVPVLWRDSKSGFRADGFPSEFRILVGTASDPVGTVVASYGAAARLLPRIAPLVLSFPSINASWVRVEAKVISPRAWEESLSSNWLRCSFSAARRMSPSGDPSKPHRPL